MQNFRAPGNVVELTAGPGDVSSGDIQWWGVGRCGVAVHDVIGGEKGSFATTGVFEFTVAAGSGDLSQGDMCNGVANEPEVTTAAGAVCGRVLTTGPVSAGGKVLVRLEGSGA